MSFRLPSVIVYQQLLSTTISPSTPFMDLCVVGPVYQCQTNASMDDYEIHTIDEYIKNFPELKTGAVIDAKSVYLKLANINVKVWPTNTAKRNNVVLDNSGPTSVIYDVQGAVTTESLDTAAIIEGDQVDIRFTDTDGKIKVKTAKIYSITQDEVSGKKTYILQKNLLTGLYPTTATVSATVKRSVSGTRDVYPGATGTLEPKGFDLIYNIDGSVKAMRISVGNLEVPVDEEATSTTTVVDCNVAVTYRALRTDVANDFITINSYSEALAQFGNPNIDNPMSVAAQVINSAVGVVRYKVLPIATDDFNGYNQALDVLSNSDAVYAIQPLSHDKQVISAYVTHCKAMSEAEKSKWRIIYGNMPMPATKIVVELNNGTLMTMGSDTELTLDYSFTTNDTATATDTGWVDAGSSSFTREITLTNKFLSLYNGTERVPKTGGTISYSYNEATKVLSIIAPSKFAGKVCMDNPNFDYANATCYLKDLDTNVGGFISNIARPTDYVDLYTVASNGETTYKYSLQIAKVLTDSACICYTQKWLKKTDGYYMIDGEYQHFIPEYKDSGAVEDLTACAYEVVRVLDTQGMAEAIAGVAESFKTKRFRYVQPDQIIITVNSVDYLVGGEYLCVALGAMRAALPPHQGFSTMGISGINRITRSNKMFTEDQLTYMASKGVFWVAQDAVDELPYVLYQTTTDNGQLEVQEDSIVAVADYASKFYKENLKNVLGRYNVNTISMNYVKTVINACSNEMTSTSYEYIGPMLTSANLLSLVADGDKIKPTIKIGVPYPVNGVDITLQV